MKTSYRLAVPTDASQITDLLAQTWPDENADYKRVQRVISSGNHNTLLAVLGSEVVGLLDTFITDAQGKRRLELDLLAVAEQWRGHGIAKELANQASGQLATNLSMLRALVRTDNTPAQRTFRSIGL
ncbi:MAG: GNAT family N-acetyltransferase, partial [Chloroflexota bacterium]